MEHPERFWGFIDTSERVFKLVRKVLHDVTEIVVDGIIRGWRVLSFLAVVFNVGGADLISRDTEGVEDVVIWSPL
jgi:hypothetical protein